MPVSPPDPPAAPLPLAAVITELDPGGAEQAFVRVVLGLKGRGWAPHMFALRGGSLRESFISAGVPVTLMDSLPGVDPRPLRRYLRQERPPAVLSFLFHANLLTRLTAASAGRPAVVCGVRVAERRRNGHRLLDRLTAPLVDRWVCVGESVRRFCVASPLAGGGGLPVARVVTIPNGVDAERWADAAPADRAALRLPPHGPVLLFAGRLDVQKDPDTLLEAFARLDRRDAHLLIAGDGPLAERVRLWAATNLAGERVRTLGRRDDLPALMRLADAFVLPSRWEGTPNVLLEAAAAGVPIVATAVDGTAEVFTHKETARLVPVGDTAALAEELRWTLDHPADAAAMAERARAVVLQNHCWEAVVAAYDALLREAISERAAGRRPGR
ncbi:glycosyltransferase [Alienimonas californiensis]|uniref:GalNAc-alpha-(1->4)-GalNAc-alpha-(1->3)-diNAcBac-PP-undecaprenol alpha-1,4-N-acetyl-D-galactosaminyltransferase n=1 Tax=Alienimonas californiensis TaxID=2527989 RepID=A0A517PCU4_9PLAN|nr:glycosyltransferase [Alienimonas californiensis]QDT17151.1 GalNAc-alpha-(1->4)-GalNAc-alpha-(1->3)-diNAcBac-PP-undecaprenol alpha-1,4-N-acetyl-D-galactosaminyltransferase [Alienimonas californiensis]